VTVTDGFTTVSLNCTHGSLSHFIGPAELHWHHNVWKLYTVGCHWL